jgi:Cu/Ag efflux protein CusF
MKPNRFAAGVVLAATLASASWAQVPGDTNPRPSQAATPMTHLAIGTVKSIDAVGRTVTIDHQAIPSLGMPAMTMQFQLAPSSRLALKPGLSIAFTFTASADGLTIGAAQPIQGVAGNAVPERPPAESSMPNMDRPGMAGMAGMMDSCQDMMRGKR